MFLIWDQFCNTDVDWDHWRMFGCKLSNTTEISTGRSIQDRLTQSALHRSLVELASEVFHLPKLIWLLFPKVSWARGSLSEDCFANPRPIQCNVRNFCKKRSENDPLWQHILVRCMWYMPGSTNCYRLRILLTLLHCYYYLAIVKSVQPKTLFIFRVRAT